MSHLEGRSFSPVEPILERGLLALRPRLHRDRRAAAFIEAQCPAKNELGEACLAWLNHPVSPLSANCPALGEPIVKSRHSFSHRYNPTAQLPTLCAALELRSTANASRRPHVKATHSTRRNVPHSQPGITRSMEGEVGAVVVECEIRSAILKQISSAPSASLR
jgi:hypothetical protein